MNQAIRDRFYSQGNKKHVEYVIRTSGIFQSTLPVGGATVSWYTIQTSDCETGKIYDVKKDVKNQKLIGI